MDLDEIIRYEQALLDTFPPLETDSVGGLALGAANGVTRRANSACALGEPIGHPAELMDRVEEWYRSRNLVPSVRVSPATPSTLIDELDRRAYLGGGGHLAPTLAMALARLNAAPGPSNSQVEVHLERPPDWGGQRSIPSRRCRDCSNAPTG